MDDHNKRVIETALLCAQEPLTVADLTRLFAEDIASSEIDEALVELQKSWEDKGMELVHIATAGTFRVVWRCVNTLIVSLQKNHQSILVR